MVSKNVLSASRAGRRMQCPGSHALESSLPKDENSEFAREGIAAHQVASQFLLNKEVIEGKLTVQGEPITEEMIEGAILYTDTIAQCVENLSFLHIEEPLNISSIHQNCWGTPDCWAFMHGHLFIWDYKFGHSHVEVFENYQLIEYAAGILQKLNLDFSLNQNLPIIFCIVQPRGFHKDGPVRKWEVTLSELLPYFDKLKITEAYAMSSDPVCRPSAECNNCSANFKCSVLRESALQNIDFAKKNTPIELSEEELGTLLKITRQAIKRLEALNIGLTEQILAKIKKGQRIPFFEMAYTSGRDYWNVPIEEVIILGELFGLKLAKPIEAVTPKQALKLGIPEQLIKSYSETSGGNPKLQEMNLKQINKIKFSKPSTKGDIKNDRN